MQTLARVLAPATDQTQTAQHPHQDVLHYLAIGGRPALQELAEKSGTSESVFLHRAFGLRPPVPVQAPPGLEDRGQRTHSFVY